MADERPNTSREKTLAPRPESREAGPQRRKMERSMPGLPNTWEYDRQKAQGGLIGSHIANKGDIDLDPGPRTEA